MGDQGGQSRESPQHCWPSGARLGRVSACRGTNRDLGRASQPCLPLSFSLQRESANILISSHTQTPRPDPRIHILGDLHKLPAINRAHEVQGLRASTLAKNTVQEDWKEGKGRGLPRRARRRGEQRSGISVSGCAPWVSESLAAATVWLGCSGRYITSRGKSMSSSQHCFALLGLCICSPGQSSP